MKITFKAHDGLCPYYIYSEYKFFIRDKADYHGRYKYALYIQRMTEQTKTFDSAKDAMNYVKEIKGAKHIYTQYGTGRQLYTDRANDYVVTGNEVVIRPAEEMVSWWYDSYADCLNFSKEYVLNFIKDREPEQLTIYEKQRR